MMKLEEIKRQIAQIVDINKFFLLCNENTNPPTKNWLFATLPLEKSFDTFMQQLAELDRSTAILFATFFARYAWDYVFENHLVQVKDLGFAFLETDPCLDGETIEKQLKNVEAWLKEPTQENTQVVKKGIDHSRQVEVWEEDLFPPDDQMWLWIIENTQLLSMAVVAGDLEINDDDPAQSPYSWSYKACIARSALCSLKSIAAEKRNLEEDLISLFGKVREEW
ncbi:hypothetical protein JXL83_01070 [candidate division WOR-3 bacterium]|nr:hypothetical protein [candidate division WOR-3 bacterium]